MGNIKNAKLLLDMGAFRLVKLNEYHAVYILEEKIGQDNDQWKSQWTSSEEDSKGTPEFVLCKAIDDLLGKIGPNVR